MLKIVTSGAPARNAAVPTGGLATKAPWGAQERAKMFKVATSGAHARNAAVPTGGLAKNARALKMHQNAQNRDFWRPCEERHSPYRGLAKKRAPPGVARGGGGKKRAPKGPKNASKCTKS